MSANIWLLKWRVLPFKVPTDLTDSYRFFTFKSHADFADDADFFH